MIEALRSSARRTSRRSRGTHPLARPGPRIMPTRRCRPGDPGRPLAVTTLADRILEAARHAGRHGGRGRPRQERLGGVARVAFNRIARLSAPETRRKAPEPRSFVLSAGRGLLPGGRRPARSCRSHSAPSTRMPRARRWTICSINCPRRNLHGSIQRDRSAGDFAPALHVETGIANRGPAHRTLRRRGDLVPYCERLRTDLRVAISPAGGPRRTPCLTCRRQARCEAHRLYTEMSATGHADRLARELAASP